ncbi:MAG TPA: (d)CMP kinase, partial [Casimicrobiaceae bacterium]|nr:(d)CMP kinase [Casimicrobiaceae bacterium]
TLDSLLREIRERDARDVARSAAPLKPAADAHILDTTTLSIGEAVSFVLEKYQQLLIRDRGL